MTAMPHQNPDAGRYALVITNDGQLLNNTVHATRAERRDACVEVLTDTCTDVKKADVTDILLTFGGADPDAAVGSISELYADFGVDIYLEDQAAEESTSNLGLPLLHSVFVDYGENESAANSIVHFTDATKRADHLRNRLINLHTAAEMSLTEPELAQRLQDTLRGLISDEVIVRLISTDSIV